jgi:pantoate--beta-alanine ligase
MVLRGPDELQAACERARAQGLSVGFVPTMGALHDGHLALVRGAKKRAAFVVCSIFVNPTQFGPNEDLARYPRDLEGDMRKLEGVDLVFAPEPAAMYPKGETTRVRVDELTSHLCGPLRPGHFEGVATVCAKLFSLVGRSVAVFGKKDYQQLAVLRRMVKDLFFPIEIVGHPIVREANGLAMSSRNAYLSAEERARALSIPAGLTSAFLAFSKGERRHDALRKSVVDSIARVSSRIDYVTLADPDTLTPYPNGATVPDRVLVAVACHVGSTRLIDNIVLGEDPSPLRIDA